MLQLLTAGAAHAEGPTLLGFSAEGWVYVGLTIFLLIAIFVGKLPQTIAKTLDQRIADTRRQLDEAAALRAEAEKLLADARARAEASAGDAAAIIAQAESEARAMLAKAESDAAQLIARRQHMAEDKIAAAERGAVADLRATAAAAAVKAAGTLIAGQVDARADSALIDNAIGTLDRAH